MQQPPKTVYRVLSYSRVTRRAAHRWFTSKKQAEQEAAAGAVIHRYELQDDAGQHMPRDTD